MEGPVFVTRIKNEVTSQHKGSMDIYITDLGREDSRHITYEGCSFCPLLVCTSLGFRDMSCVFWSSNLAV